MEPCSAARVCLLLVVAVSVISGSVASSAFGSGYAESGFQGITETTNITLVRVHGGKTNKKMKT